MRSFDAIIRFIIWELTGRRAEIREENGFRQCDILRYIRLAGCVHGYKQIYQLYFNTLHERFKVLLLNMVDLFVYGFSYTHLAGRLLTR